VDLADLVSPVRRGWRRVVGGASAPTRFLSRLKPLPQFFLLGALLFGARHRPHPEPQAPGVRSLRDVDLQSLVSEASARTAESSTGSGAGTTAVPCEAELRAAEPTLGAATHVGDGTWDGAAAAVVVFERDGGERIAYVVLYEGCAVMTSQPVD